MSGEMTVMKKSMTPTVTPELAEDRAEMDTRANQMEIDRKEPPRISPPTSSPLLLKLKSVTSISHRATPPPLPSPSLPYSLPMMTPSLNRSGGADGDTRGSRGPAPVTSDQSVAVPSPPSSKSQRTDRAKPNCAKCKAHDVYQRVKNHKRECRYRMCPCKKCLSVDQRRSEMALQTFRKREKAKKEKREKRPHGSPSPSPSPPPAPSPPVKVTTIRKLDDGSTDNQVPAPPSPTAISQLSPKANSQKTRWTSINTLSQSSNRVVGAGSSHEILYDPPRQSAYNRIFDAQHDKRPGVVDRTLWDDVRPNFFRYPFTTFCYPPLSPTLPSPSFPTTLPYSTGTIPLGFYYPYGWTMRDAGQYVPITYPQVNRSSSNLDFKYERKTSSPTPWTTEAPRDWGVDLGTYR